MNGETKFKVGDRFRARADVPNLPQGVDRGREFEVRSITYVSDPTHGDVLYADGLPWGCWTAHAELVDDAKSDGGLKFDGGKPRMDLLPMDALEGIATVLGFGAKKYGDRNWEKGIAWGRLAGAALRHLGAWMMGKDLDDESKLPHLHHFGCCALMLIALVLRKQGEDTRGVSSPGASPVVGS